VSDREKNQCPASGLRWILQWPRRLQKEVRDSEPLPDGRGSSDLFLDRDLAWAVENWGLRLFFDHKGIVAQGFAWQNT